MLREGRIWQPEIAEQNTVLVVVATNAALTKEQANRLATVCHDGLARAVRPAHTPSDGDVVFTLATGERALEGADYRILEAIATRAVERAIVAGDDGGDARRLSVVRTLARERERRSTANEWPSIGVSDAMSRSN